MPVLAWALLLFILSSVPGNNYPEVGWRFADKWVHFALYTPFGILLARWLELRWRGSAAVLAGWVYGATDEMHQLWVPRRSCDFADWMIDAIAVVIGAGCFLMLRRHVSLSASDFASDQQWNPESP
ncbi:MAG: VanZ family protein [Candidatus Sumerlaeaceae bacterium]